MKHGMKKMTALGLAGAMALCTGCGTAAGSTASSTASSETTQAASTAESTAADSVMESPLDPAKPTTITVWNYYNGDQLAAFDALVSQFNSTVGLDEGIAVESTSQSNINDLADALLSSAEGKVGAQALPDAASIYAETAYILEQQDALVNLDEYFTAEELSAYVPGFVEEGRMTDGGALRLIPVMKSTECFSVNTTDWAAFEEACGIAPDSITTYEQLSAAAKAYYEWTDSLTPDVAGDGKSLYGRDSLANYMYTGTKQLGHEMFVPNADGTLTIDLDRDTFKTLWDNYYIPFINGYFYAGASFRSEDMKTGAVLAVTSSTSGVSYLPVAVTDENEVTHDISLSVAKPLSFENGKEVAVQQGAGYCVMKSTPEKQYAAARFLKWLTETEQNFTFSISSGYSPATISANDLNAIQSAFSGTEANAKDQNMMQALLVSADVYNSEETYSCRPFNGGKEVRSLLDSRLGDICTADRAAVLEAISAGTPQEEAVAPYVTDEYFDTWYNALCDEINGLAGAK